MHPLPFRVRALRLALRFLLAALLLVGSPTKSSAVILIENLELLELFAIVGVEFTSYSTSERTTLRVENTKTGQSGVVDVQGQTEAQPKLTLWVFSREQIGEKLVVEIDVAPLGEPGQRRFIQVDGRVSASTRRITDPALAELVGGLSFGFRLQSETVDPETGNRHTMYRLESVEAEARSRVSRVVVRPGDSIQAAVHTVADGGTVLIEPGIYEESVTVSGKIVHLVGSGARDENRTELVGRTPREVVDAKRARALLEYRKGGGGTVEGILFRGGDAAISANDRNHPAGALVVDRSAIAETGRGILWSSPSDLTVRRTSIRNTLGNGIAVVLSRQKLDVSEVILSLIGEAGIYVSNTTGPSGVQDCDPDTLFVIRIDDVFVGSASGGGILVFGGAQPVCITGGLLVANRYAGIRLMKTVYAEVHGTVILDTAPRLTDGAFGDGVLAWLSDFTLLEGLDIERSARSGMTAHGSFIAFGNDSLNCNTIHLAGENLAADQFGPGNPPQDRPFGFHDLGGNTCGCGDEFQACQVLSSTLTPPSPNDPGP